MVDESQNKLNDQGASSMIGQDKSSGKILGSKNIYYYSWFHRLIYAGLLIMC